MRLDASLNMPPCLELRLIRQLGLLDRCGRAGLVIDDIKLLVESYPPDDKIFITMIADDKAFINEISLGVTYLTGGKKRTSFICPITGAHCRKLYLSHVGFASRQGTPGLNHSNSSPVQRHEQKLLRMRDRLLGLDGRGPARGRNRERLIDGLRKEPLIQLRWPELDEAFWNASQKQARTESRPLRSSHRSSHASTAAALKAGQPAAAVDLDPYLTLPSAALNNRLPLPSGYPRQLPVAILEGHPSLDIGVLGAFLRPLEFELCGHFLRWNDQAGNLLCEMLAIFDLRSPDQPLLSLQSPDGAHFHLQQLIRLFPRASDRRWYMECPILGTRHDLLFLRDGDFASAKGNRLVHRSQRGAL